MSIKKLKEIYDTERKRRVIIYENNLGSFGYEQEYFSENPSEMCWIPTGRKVAGFYDSAETAETEAQANVNWLKDVK